MSAAMSSGSVIPSLPQTASASSEKPYNTIPCPCIPRLAGPSLAATNPSMPGLFCIDFEAHYLESPISGAEVRNANKSASHANHFV